MQPMLFRIFTDKGLRTFSWRLSGRIVAVSGREERERAVEKVIRRIMREDGLVAHVPGRRRYSSYEGEVTPAPNVKWLTDTTRDQGP